MAQIPNERTKLTATWLNGASVACLAVGAISPIVTAPAGFPLKSAVWLLVGLGLHFVALAVLGRLKE